MPYANGTYSLPPGTSGTTLTPIDSSDYNAFTADIAAAQNAARPITAGGTGKTTAVAAHDALVTKGTDIASAATLDLDDATGANVNITGATTVTAVTLTTGRTRLARAAAAFELTASASLIVNGSTTESYTTKANDLLLFEGYASNVVRVWIVASERTTPNADTRNRIVNPAMQVSQQNGDTSGTTDLYYGADQWATQRITSAGTITTQRVAEVTPGGSPYRYQVTVTTADTTLAAGEILAVFQNLEGADVADFLYGGADARQSVLRVGFSGPAGTYAIRLINSAADRSYVALFTISADDANTDTVQTFAIPGDTTGTWLTAEGVIGINLTIALACGSTYQGVEGWQAGNIYGTSGVSNGMGTQGNVFQIFDVGLYLDPDETGVAPAWELPDAAEEERGCKRFWRNTFYGVGTWVTTTLWIGNGSFDVVMAKTPVVSNPTGFIYQLGASDATVVSLSVSYLRKDGGSIAINTSARTAGVVGITPSITTAFNVDISARLA